MGLLPLISTALLSEIERLQKGGLRFADGMYSGRGL